MNAKEKARFVIDHRADLIQKVSTVMPVVESLGDMVHAEIEARISAQSTPMEKMRELYETIVNQGSTRVKAAFYDALMKHQPHLLKSLGASSGESMDADEEAKGLVDGKPSQPTPRKRKKVPPTKAPGQVSTQTAPPVATEPPVSPQITNREEFFNESCPLSLDENTVGRYLSLSDDDMLAQYENEVQHHPEHADRFTAQNQVLSRESLSERCYFEVEWYGRVSVAVSYRDIDKKTSGPSRFGYNDRSWMLGWYDSVSGNRYKFVHNSVDKDLRLSVPEPAEWYGRWKGVWGVRVDRAAGTVSFYSVDESSKTKTLLYTVNNAGFTQALYAGIWVRSKGSNAQLRTIPKS